VRHEELHAILYARHKYVLARIAERVAVADRADLEFVRQAAANREPRRI